MKTGLLSSIARRGYIDVSEIFYQDDLVTLYHGDCREITEWLAADVLVTDPPYGMALRSGHHGDFGDLEIVGDSSLELRDYVLEAWGELRPALVFGRWSIERPAGTKTVLTWEKGNHTGMGDLNIPWSPTTEEVYVLGRWPKRESRGRNGGGRDPATIVAMAPAPARRNGRLHPTEKPLTLATRLVDKCPPGATVADPFAGSGPFLLAAKMLGRKAIGVELEERYCEIAAQRLLQDALPFEVGA